MDCNSLFSKAQKEQIVEAIKSAELNTSGEIRLHLEDYCDRDAYDRGLHIFYELKMDQTAFKNGVLIYVALKDRKLSIIADKGINDLVLDNYWNEILEKLKNQFIKKQYFEGLLEAIDQIGHQIKEYFPYQSNDKNELTNEISFG